MTTTWTATRGVRPALLGAVAATMALAGCGSSSSPATTAAKATGSQASSSSPASPGASSGPASPPVAAVPSMAELATRVSNATKAKGTAHLSTNVAGASAVRSTGVLRFGASGTEFAATTSIPGGQSVKMVFVAGAAYMNVGQKYQGKNWIRIAPGGSDPLSKALGPLLTQLGTNLDIKSQLASAKGSAVTRAERSTLGGAPVTKYTVTSSEKALLAQLDKFTTAPELRKKLAAQFKGAHGESVMWITDDGLPLRVDSRLVGGSQPATTTTVTYSDWGKPVTIAAPPERDVVDLGA